MAVPVDLSDRESMIKNAATSLNSKIISQNSSLLAPLAVDAVMKVCAQLSLLASACVCLC